MFTLGNIIAFLVLSALTFWLVSQKFIYSLTGSATKLVQWETSTDGLPNDEGKKLHAAVFIVAVVILGFAFLGGCSEGFNMNDDDDEEEKKKRMRN